MFPAVAAVMLAVASTPLAAQSTGSGMGSDKGMMMKQHDDVGLAVGTVAPSAAVETLDGTAVDISHYIGTTPVVLEFWATWCPLCKQLEPAMQAARSTYDGRIRFVSVGVNKNQTPAKQKAYAAAKGLGGEYVYDADGKAVAAYKVPDTSYLVVIDGAGKVVYTGVGGHQNVDAAIAKALR
jgi:thiol-disulfide isomerase/thioredoxin